MLKNEGELPLGISLDSLKRQHPSRPRNLLIADVCFKGGYIDAWGSGTLKIISACKEAGLPEPEIIEQDGGILVTVYKNKLTEEQLLKLGLNERQINVIKYILEFGVITNSKYQELNTTKKTLATEDLNELVGKGLIKQAGTKGRGSKYELIA
jgi:ATP-dependent DNA helicase RecG